MCVQRPRKKSSKEMVRADVGGWLFSSQPEDEVVNEAPFLSIRFGSTKERRGLKETNKGGSSRIDVKEKGGNVNKDH